MGSAEEVNADTAWMGRAACTGLDPNVFVPERGASTRRAREVCAGCPVAQPCLEYALMNRIKTGVWGGTTDRQRRSILKARRKAAAGA